MRQQAEGLLEDAEMLGRPLGSRSDGGYLLRLLALEILLKAVYRGASGTVKKGHRYRDLVGGLPPATRARLLEEAAQRLAGEVTWESVGEVLETLSHNFVHLRYAYEEYEEMSDEELSQMEKKWLEEGATLEDATFVYYPEELMGLTHAALVVIGEWEAGIDSRDAGRSREANGA